MLGYVELEDGEQFSSGFVEINPNSKIPALLDRSVEGSQRVFESGAILLYLAEKFGAFIPEDPIEKTECMSWLFWQMASAPYLGGSFLLLQKENFGHFYAYAPEKFEYPIKSVRYGKTKRQLDLLDQRLSKNEFIAGS